MTERSLGSDISWWIGEVVNVKDPDQSGRVQVRVYGKHDDKTNVPDKILPWALPLQPVTSAAYGKIGTAPLGLVRGSKVMGFWMDSNEKQYPVIWGSFGKAGDPLPGQSKDGTEKIDTKKGSIPGPSQNNSDPVPINPYSNLFGSKIDINKINDPATTTFKTIDKYVPTTGIENNKKVDTKLKEPKKPTTASAKKDDTGDVLDIVKQVDPNKLSRVLPDAVDGFNSVRNIMSMTSPAGLTNLLSGGLQGMIGGLAGKMGLGPAMAMMNGLAVSGALSGVAQNALKSAIASTALSAIRNGGVLPPSNLISTIIPTVNPLRLPQRTLIVLDPGPTYVQQYYPLEQEPFPGYIEFVDVATQVIAYKLRGNEPHYHSAQAHIQANTSTEMLRKTAILFGTGVIAGAGITAAKDLINGVSLPDSLTSSLAEIVNGGLGAVAAQGISSILGKGVNLGNITSLAAKLLPAGLAGGIQGLMNGHLPTSVLDPGKIGPAMGEFTKNQALMQLKKKEMKKALDPKKADAQAKEYSDLSKTSAAGQQAQNLVTAESGLDGDFTGVGGVQSSPDLATTLIQNNPGGTGNAATDVGSPFG